MCKIRKIPLLVAVALGVVVARADTHFVDANGAHQWPFDTWAKAATNIQQAANTAVDGDTVLVTNGTYHLAATVNLDGKDIVLRSVNGAAATILDGGYPVSTTRCIYVDNVADTTIQGFTIRGGGAALNGGGVWFEGMGWIVDCVFTGNVQGALIAHRYGPGDLTVSGCTFVANSLDSVGSAVVGIQGSIMSHCSVFANTNLSAQTEPPIVQGGFGSEVRNSLIARNYGVAVRNIDNVANCTIVDNHNPYNYSGGVSGCTVWNSIIYYNTSGSPSTTKNYKGGELHYSCTTPQVPDISGTGNFDMPPEFVGFSVPDYHLATNSPCIDTGTNQPGMSSAVDLDGRVRIMNGTVDRGCYEYDAAALTTTSTTTSTSTTSTSTSSTTTTTTTILSSSTSSSTTSTTSSSTTTLPVADRVRWDFDGDGASDAAVMRSASGRIRLIESGDGSRFTTAWGSPDWMPAAGDYDGDGVYDFGWFVRAAHVFRVYETAAAYAERRPRASLGAAVDVPLPADYDGDGITDIAVCRVQSGKIRVINSSDGQQWTSDVGYPGLTPTVADFDGDGLADLAWYHQQTKAWRIHRSASAYAELRPRPNFGGVGDVPVPADFDGDGRADLAVYRRISGKIRVLESSTGFQWTTDIGNPAWLPGVGDYDGDGQSDCAWLRPGSGTFLVILSDADNTDLSDNVRAVIDVDAGPRDWPVACPLLGW